MRTPNELVGSIIAVLALKAVEVVGDDVVAVETLVMLDADEVVEEPALEVDALEVVV